MKLWLARHAQPLVAAGVCYGATNMAADGQATQVAAEQLALALPPGVQLIASPLQRCAQLAQSLVKLRPDLACSTDDRLAEMNFGHWEGQRWQDIPKEHFDRWTDNFGTHRFGEVESVNDLLARVGQAWDETQSTGQDTVWITHAGVIRAALLLGQGLRQLQQAAQWPAEAPAFGGWTLLEN